jgi:hypothetical protein
VRNSVSVFGNIGLIEASSVLPKLRTKERNGIAKSEKEDREMICANCGKAYEEHFVIPDCETRYYI